MSTQAAVVLHLFINTLGNSRYTFKNGKNAHFIDGTFTTSLQSEIDELNEEIEAGNPYIKVDPNRVTITADELDPIEMIRKKAVEDYKAKLSAAQDTEKNLSESDSGKLSGIGTTASIADMAAGSTSTDASPGAALLATPGASARLSALSTQMKK